MRSKVWAILLSFFATTMLSPVVWSAQYEKQYFTVTAYYSPKPDQKYYLKWNYDAERRLNGMGIKGASWKNVYPWMCAAPKNYKFWTKIYLEWLWICSVDDRGWAIVNAGNRWYKYDRLDLWVWEWDEWLRRALYWGKRRVAWYIVPSNTDTTINIYDIAAPSWATNSLEVREDLFAENVWLYSAKNTIILLQKRLTEMWLYDGPLNGNYNNIVWIIFDYQINNKIIKSQYALWAWYTGPKTRKYLKKDYFEFKERQIFEEKRKKYLKDKFNEFTENAYDEAASRMAEIWTPKFGDISLWVRELQKLLKEFWYFDHKDTAIFWNITKTALLEYQLERKIILDPNDRSGGRYGPKTKQSLLNDLKSQYLNKMIESEDDDIESEELSKYWIYTI